MVLIMTSIHSEDNVIKKNAFDVNDTGGDLWLKYKGTEGLAGSGKHIVLVAAEPEYRSEETMPMLAKILSKRHGFNCSVLFAIDPNTKLINPTVKDNIPGLDLLKTADLLILNIRFRELPEDQRKCLTDYFESGKPVIGIRTTTHGFRGPLSYAGASVFGPWGGHHGRHKYQGTRGVIVESQKTHPVNIGVKDIFGKTDVYATNLEKLEELKATHLVLGQVTETLEPDSGKAVTNAKDKQGRDKNDPMRPIVWTRKHKWKNGKESQILTSTIGASVDFVHEGARRIILNACYWLLDMEKHITADLDCSFVGEYTPTMYETLSKKEMWTEKKLKPSNFK